MPQLNVRISDELFTQLRQDAKAKGLSQSELIRQRLEGTPIKVELSPSRPVEQRERIAREAALPLTALTPLQVSGQTGLPLTVCERMLALGRVTVENGRARVDGA